MSHKIIMLGGRRAGKSTILASILKVLKSNTPGSVFTINDITDYSEKLYDNNGNLISIPTLNSKRIEVVNGYIKPNQGSNKNFIVDTSPSYNKASYTLRINTSNKHVDFEFVDVPGEWMRANVSDHSVLKELIVESDVFVIAIDTPYLMYEDEDVNMLYNRVDEITNTIATIKVDPEVEVDSKLIILAPVKCEKWVQSGEVDKITQKVKLTYRNLINKWVQFPNVEIWIMPIQTVGGLESTMLLPALLYFRDENDRIEGGITCSYDDNTNLLIDKNGNTINPNDVETENDMSWRIDYTDIPISWFKANNNGFAPKYCEQPGYHILRFLVNKEYKIMRLKSEPNSIIKNNRLLLWLNRIYNAIFGKDLHVWKKVIDEMKSRNIIKEHGDGFEHVTEIIENNVNN